MKLYIWNVLFVFTMVFVSCSSSLPTEKEKLVNQIRNQTAHELFQKEELLVSVVGSSMMNEIKNIFLGLDYKKKCEIERGRYLAITASQLLLKNINENEEIRKYLIEYPFTEFGVDISIYCSLEGNIPPRSSLSVVACRNGKLVYMVGAENDVVFEETYQEALKIVQEENRKNLKDKSEK